MWVAAICINQNDKEEKLRDTADDSNILQCAKGIRIAWPRSTWQCHCNGFFESLTYGAPKVPK
jgi:hypothetical protein